MRRIIQEHPTLAARSLPRLFGATLVAGALLFAPPHAADAALTTGKCLGQKRTAWTTLRKCQGTEQTKQLNGKPADLAKCLAKFQDALAKISAKAAKAAIACRYGDNGDGTVTDYDTGLQWEKKDGAGGTPDLANPHDVDNMYGWGLNADFSFGGVRDGSAFTDFLARLDDSESSDGVTESLCFVGHCDWRLPTIVELQSIRDTSVPGCGSGSPCINPIFGLTAASRYCSATTSADSQGNNWVVNFFSGEVDTGGKDDGCNVRAVRTGL